VEETTIVPRIETIDPPCLVVGVACELTVTVDADFSECSYEVGCVINVVVG
jgi:hypothetical protein